MFRHLSNLALFAAFVLFGLSGGLVVASCESPECVILTFEYYRVQGGGFGCIQYEGSYGKSAFATTGGGVIHCGSGNRMRYRGSCQSCVCPVTEPFGASEACLAVTGSVSLYEDIENCTCIES